MSSVTDLAAFAATVQRAARSWQEAGIEKRLRALQTAGAQLAARRSSVHEAFLAEGMSGDLARRYAEIIVQAGDPTLLEKYAANLTQWISSQSDNGANNG